MFQLIHVGFASYPRIGGKKRTFMSRDSAGACGKEGVERGCYFCCCNYSVAKSLTLDVSSQGLFDCPVVMGRRRAGPEAQADEEQLVAA